MKVIDFIPLELFTRKPPGHKEFCRLLEDAGFERDSDKSNAYSFGKWKYVLSDTVKKIHGNEAYEMNYKEAAEDIKDYMEVNETLLNGGFIKEPSEFGVERYISQSGNFEIFVDGVVRVIYNGKEYDFTYKGSLPCIDGLSARRPKLKKE